MSLESFLNKFNSADGKYAYTIDPLKYFTVSVQFAHGSGGGGSGAMSILQKGIQSVMNNITGGLYGKLKNASKSEMGKNGYPDIPSLATASLITDMEGNSLDLTYFAQDGVLPSISVLDGTAAETVAGTIKTHRMAVETDSKDFTLRVLNTRVSIIDRIFYPWMREISYPYWSYQDQPYETATIRIDFTSHNDIAYVFLGCRPTRIQALNPTNQLDVNMVRDVVFSFDYMYIESAGKNVDSIKDTLMNTGKSIISKAASMINL